MVGEWGECECGGDGLSGVKGCGDAGSSRGGGVEVPGRRRRGQGEKGGGGLEEMILLRVAWHTEVTAGQGRQQYGPF